MEPVHKIKDNVYKKVFGEPEMIVDFLKDYIPIDIVKNVKPEDIEDITERFLPLFSDNKDSDTVKKIKLQGDKSLFFIGIIEHESEVNFTASFKLFQYITYVQSDFVKENDKKHEEEVKKTGRSKIKLSTSKGFKLPPVLPIIFYDGTKKWTSSLDLLGRTELAEIFYKYIPKFEYELVDLNQYNWNDLMSFGNLLSFIFMMDKVHKPEDLELLSALPKDYLDKLNLNIPDHLLKLAADCIGMLLRKVDISKEDVDSITEKIYKRRFVDMFNPQFSVKDIREEGIKVGIKKGREEGRKESAIDMARKLLLKGISVKDIVDVTGLNEEFIETLNN